MVSWSLVVFKVLGVGGQLVLNNVSLFSYICLCIVYINIIGVVVV